jgi:hypothetical protein
MAAAISHWQTVAGARTGLAVVHFLQGELEQAQAMAQACLQAALKINFPLAKSSAEAAYRLCASLADGHGLPAAAADASLPRPGTALFMVVSHWASALRACGDDESVAWREMQAALECARDAGYPAMTTWLLPVAALLLAHKGHPQRATELLALAATHPLGAMGWTEHWAPLRDVHACLGEELGDDRFTAAWRRGETADLEQVVGALLADETRPPEMPAA